MARCIDRSDSRALSASARSGVYASAITCACRREIAPRSNAVAVAGNDSSRRASRTAAAAAPCVSRQFVRNHDAVVNAPSACHAPLRSNAAIARKRWYSSRSTSCESRATSVSASHVASFSTAASSSSSTSNICSIVRPVRQLCRRFNCPRRAPDAVLGCIAVTGRLRGETAIEQQFEGCSVSKRAATRSGCVLRTRRGTGARSSVVTGSRVLLENASSLSGRGRAQRGDHARRRSACFGDGIRARRDRRR
jgi:hypothetical protein